MNPEKNTRLRAYLYVIGIGGTIHLLTLFAIGVKNSDLSYFNPFFAVDGNELFPAFASTPLAFLGGWLATFGLIFIVYRMINRK